MAENNYIPEYVPSDLPRYERDGLMTCTINENVKSFLRTLKGILKIQKIVNFDIIHREARGLKVPDNLFKEYQTV